MLKKQRPKWVNRFNLITIGISVFVFIVLTIGVLGTPAPEAHFWNSEPLTNGYFAKIDVGLHDNWFFQWHRQHIEITLISDISAFKIFDVTTMKNATYLNPYPIFLTVLSVLTLCLCGTNLYLNLKWNKKNINNWIVNIGITSLIFILLFMGLIFYFGAILQSFMVLTLDVRKVDADFYWFDMHAGGASPSGDYDNSLLTNYDLTSVVISYSWLGILSVIFVSVVGTTICVFGGLDYYNYFKNKKNRRY